MECFQTCIEYTWFGMTISQNTSHGLSVAMCTSPMVKDQPKRHILKQQKSKRQSSSVGQPAVQLQRQPSSGDALLNGLDSLGHSALVSARRQRLEPYIQALNHAKSDLQKFVFVFLTHDSNSSNDSGELVALPAGACVKDALKEGEKLVHSLLGLNGVPTSVARKLRNGDVLNVPLSAPSLSYA